MGRTLDGENLVVGGGDGGVLPPEAMKSTSSSGGVSNENLSGSGQAGVEKPGVGQVGFGNAAASAYGSGVGEPLGTQGLQGQDSRR